MSLRRLAATALVLGVSASSTAQNQADAIVPLVITDVTVIDGTGRAPRPNMTVLVADGRIARISASTRFKPASGAQIIDGTGRYLIPGLWNMHVHSVSYEAAMKALPQLLASGVTGIRDMGAPLEGVLRLRSDKSLPMPHMIVAGPLLVRAIPPAMTNSTMIRSVNGAAQAAEALESLKRAGVDFIKVDSSISRNTYFGVAQQARAHRITFAGHVPPSISSGEASDSGQRSIEHLGGPHHAVLVACSTREAELQGEMASIMERQIEGVLRGEEPDPGQLRARVTKQIVETYSYSKARALFERFRRNGTFQVPTLVAIRGLWNTRVLTPDDLTYGEKIRQKQLEVVAGMSRSSVKILAGTDGPLSQAGPALHDELALLVKAGLSPIHALQAATRNSAEFIGRQHDLGTVEQGKIADLVLLDANPLLDINNTRRVAAVVLEGRLIVTSEAQKVTAGN